MLCGCARRLHSAALCPLCLCLSAALTRWLARSFIALRLSCPIAPGLRCLLQLSSAVLAHSGVAVQHPQPLTVSRHFEALGDFGPRPHFFTLPRSYIATQVPQLNRLKFASWLLRPTSTHVSHQCQSQSFSASNSPLPAPDPIWASALTATLRDTLACCRIPAHIPRSPSLHFIEPAWDPRGTCVGPAWDPRGIRVGPAGHAWDPRKLCGS